MDRQFNRFSEFWPWYLNQHRQPSCRALHYVGTMSIFVLIGVAFATKFWLLLLLPIVGYTPSWIGHFLIERNRPATFGHPFWAAFADFKMFGLAITGRLGSHLAAAADLAAADAADTAWEPSSPRERSGLAIADRVPSAALAAPAAADFDAVTVFAQQLLAAVGA